MNVDEIDNEAKFPETNSEAADGGGMIGKTMGEEDREMKKDLLEEENVSDTEEGDAAVNAKEIKETVENEVKNEADATKQVEVKEEADGAGTVEGNTEEDGTVNAEESEVANETDVRKGEVDVTDMKEGAGGVGMTINTMGLGDKVEEKEVAEENVAGTVEGNTEAYGAVNADETMEAEETKVTNEADVMKGNVNVEEVTEEADGARVVDMTMGAEDKEEEQEENVAGMMEGNAEADGAVNVEETMEAEETEVANEEDVMKEEVEVKEEVDGAGKTLGAEYKEGEEEENVAGMVEGNAEADGAFNVEETMKIEEIEVANEADTMKEEVSEVKEKADEAHMAVKTMGEEDKVVAEEENVSGMMAGNAEEAMEAEETDGAVDSEEALETEEIELVNEADVMKEEVDVAEETMDADETEAAEEEIRSSTGAKRKRVRNSKATIRVPSKKKMEEDVCFICFDGGELVLCDRRGCPKAYHPSCVNRDEAFFRAKGRWNCGWHLCSICEKNAYYMCYTCTFSLCKGCIKDAVILCVRGNKGFCETCKRTVMLIEQNEQGTNDTGQVDFNDKNSWEYLFKDYWTDLKRRLSLTYDELTQAKNPWKGSEKLPAKQESPVELYDANNDRGLDSDSSAGNVEMNNSKKRKAKKRLKSRSKEGNSRSMTTSISAEGSFMDGTSEWASKELLEFVMHMRSGNKSVLSQFDVQALLLEYIKINKLRDPRRKSQIICDSRLQNLFGKPRVGHFEMLKLLESHFIVKEDSLSEDLQGSVVDTEANQLEGDGKSDALLKTGKDKRRRTRKKGDTRGLQSNIDDYGAVDIHNINLIYLRRSLVEYLIEDKENFHDKVVGSFVRIRISGSGQKHDLYRLVQVVGTCTAAEPYKVGKRMTDIMLEILNLNKTEVISSDIISNQEFTEDECKRLRQSIKCGLINRLTVGDIQEKAMALQAVRVKDWLETEINRLSHLRDRASEKGRRKELRECVEKLQILKSPEERQRRLEEIPEIHADPNMDPSYESEEDEDKMDGKREESYLRPRSSGFGRGGNEPNSPRKGGSAMNDSWSSTRNYRNVNREFSRNISSKGFSNKGDDVASASEMSNDISWHQGRDRESQHLSNSWEKQKISSTLETGPRNAQPVVISESFSAAVSEAASPSTGAAQPAAKLNETEKIWHYKDPAGKVQGPFSIVQLRKWSNTGYFPADLRIWRTTENPDDSILLTDALAGKIHKEPSLMEKSFPRAQMVHDSHHSSLYSGKLNATLTQGIEGQVGGKSKFDQSSGSWSPHATLGSSGEPAAGSLRFKDNLTSSVGKSASLSVEVSTNSADGCGSDYGTRSEATNLPSPTPQTNPSATKGQGFESKWSPGNVPSAGSVLGANTLAEGCGRLQTPALVLSDSMVQGSENDSSISGVTSTPQSQKGMLSSSGMHPQVTLAAPVLADGSTNAGVDSKTTANIQDLIQSMVSRSSHIHAQGWGSGLVPIPEMGPSTKIHGSEPQAWGSAPTRVEPNNLATIPAQPPAPGHLGNTSSSVQNSASFNTGNLTGSFPMPGFPVMTTPETWRPPAPGNQSMQPPTPPSLPWGMGVADNRSVVPRMAPENQNAGWGVMPGNPNMSWGGAVPTNANINWTPNQGPAATNVNQGWVAPGQGTAPVNMIPGWMAPGQGAFNANPGWVVPGQGTPSGNANPGWAVPGQGTPSGNANPGWAASTGNSGMWGTDQRHNGDRLQNQGDQGSHGGDSGYGAVKHWNRQSSFSSGGGGSSRPPFQGHRVCKYHENGHCKKGASCDYMHT
ncbi:Zinc finger CCCH domain-containing protein 19 [Quillaja saponaria]|uniref:Zinc finger CCCH domain-containing protein 19 n=1 Tax=Quillaja saponaria TaxID=32244 RepID=A0AAD7P949_QUISA|nr:Zinc finger CCCH domain-containing protein 19 [Quillaja saponaria]